MASAPKVLIVEDEYLIAEYFSIVVEQLGYDVCGLARSAEEAVELAREHAPALVFMDVRLAGERDGVEAAREIQALQRVPIIYVTASREPQTSQRIKDDYPSEVLTKPVIISDIKAVLDRHCPLPHEAAGGIRVVKS